MSVVNDRALAINLLESFLYIQRPIIPPFLQESKCTKHAFFQQGEA